jgi:hypothetical protein
MVWFGSRSQLHIYWVWFSFCSVLRPLPGLGMHGRIGHLHFILTCRRHFAMSVSITGILLCRQHLSSNMLKNTDARRFCMFALLYLKKSISNF